MLIVTLNVVTTLFQHISMHFIRVKVTPLSIGQTLTQHYIRLKAVRALSIGQTLTTSYIRIEDVKMPGHMSHVNNGILTQPVKCEPLIVYLCAACGIYLL